MTATIFTAHGDIRLDLVGRALMEGYLLDRVTHDLWKVTSHDGHRSYGVRLSDTACTCKAGQQEPPVMCKHVSIVQAVALTGAVPVPAEVPHG